jgi:hypothetical protein
MHSKLTAAVVAVAGLLLAWTPSAHAQQMPADPCSQVTPAQVSTALGETVGTGERSNDKTCTWVADKPAHQVVTLSYSPPGDWNTRKTHQIFGVTTTSVSGVGDDAIAQTLGNLTTLFVKKGSTTFMVKVYGVADPQKQLAIEKPIAQAVAAKS